MYLVQPPTLLKKMYPTAIWRKDKLANEIYLTFDDGPIPSVTQNILTILKKYNVKATFFCVGDNIVKHPLVYQQILDEEHSVGNHTFNHLNGWKTHSNKYIENVELCAQAMNTVGGNKNNNLFRPPYGKAKKAQFSRLSNTNYSTIMWDVLSGDYDENTTPEKCLSNVTKHVRNGSIIVFHDSIKAQKKVEYALPRFIEYALGEGFEFEKLG